MTALIIGMILAGGIVGYVFSPEFLIENQGILISVLLCTMLFVIGIDMGRSGDLFSSVKKVGLKILLVPLMIIVGTLVFGGLGGLLAGIPLHEGMAVSAGFGWYSLGPVLISDYSSELSAVAFISNVIRETFGIIMIPIVAKYVGHIECVATAGISVMDLCLPVVERSTSERIVVYAVISGAIMSALVPILVPLFLSVKF